MAGAKYFFRIIKAGLFAWLGRYLMWLFSSPFTLDVKRCTRRDILGAVNTARANHPAAAIYIFSDRPTPAVSGTQQLSSIQELERVPAPGVIVLACNSDELALAAVRLIQSRQGIFYYGAHRLFPAARYFHRNEIGRSILKEAAAANLDKFDLADFENIIQAIHATRSREGDYVEIGVYKGDSATVALTYLERAGIRRRSYFLDTFSGFDYAGAADSKDRAWYQSHAEPSIEAVEKALARFAMPHQVIQANIITDPLPAAIRKIAVCNIDVDMYEAVAAALVKVAPRMVAGGIIIAEDAGHTPMLIGAYAAVREFLESPAGNAFVPVELMSGQMFLIKAGEIKT